jgi:hypothetical protein
MIKVLKIILFFLFSVLLIDVGFSIYDFRLTKNHSKIISKPTPLFKLDDVYGYVYDIGFKEVTINQKLVFKISINEDGTRLNPFFEQSKKNIAIFGCSFFAGMGVGDSATVGSQLQKLLKEDFSVYNYSIPGHGMNTQYLKLKELIETQKKPEIAVFQIATFHLIRNVGGYNFIKNFGKIKDSPIKYITSKIEDSGEVSFSTINVASKYSKLTNYSSIFDFIYSKIKSNQHSINYQLELQKRLLTMTFELCKKHDIVPVFIFVTKDELTKKLIKYNQNNFIPFLHSKVDYNDDRFNLNPYDQHPNERAHKQYADELFDYLKEIEVL